MVDDDNTACLDLDTFPAAPFVPPLASGEAPRDVGFLRGGISERLGRRGELWEIAYSAGGANE